MSRIKGFLSALNDIIAATATTNFKTLSAQVAAILTVIMYWVSNMLEFPVGEITFGMLLTFILTWMFDGRKQFEIKRNSQWVPSGFNTPDKSQAAPINQQSQITSARAIGKEDGTEPV